MKEIERHPSTPASAQSWCFKWCLKHMSRNPSSVTAPVTKITWKAHFWIDTKSVLVPFPPPQWSQGWMDDSLMDHSGITSTDFDFPCIDSCPVFHNNQLETLHQTCSMSHQGQGWENKRTPKAITLFEHMTNQRKDSVHYSASIFFSSLPITSS